MGVSMNITDILKYYEEVKNDLTFQNTSSVQTKIMIYLSEGSKNIEDLTKLAKIKSSIILNGINGLEKENLVLSKRNYYYLSKIGVKVTSELIDMIKTIVVLKNNQKLWLNHEVESIPYDLLMEIGNLSNSKLIEIENNDISKTHRKHTQIVLNAEKIKGVSPIFYLDYIETFNNVLDKNINVELILTEEVLKKTIESHNSKSLEKFKKSILEEKLKIWKIQENVKVAFTVTDKSITLGLFSKKGIYDSTKVLVSDHKDAIMWGNELFEYYLKRAQKIEEKDLIS
jgi:predicted transcriptional regulator